MKIDEKTHWQAVRGIAIISVVLIHSLSGYDYNNNLEYIFFVGIRKLINFAVAIFVFMAGYFVNQERFGDKNIKYKEWIYRRCVRLVSPFVVWSVIYSTITILQASYNNVEIYWLHYVYSFFVGKSAAPFYYIIVLLQFTILTPSILKVVKSNTKSAKMLWFITPTYLLYVYLWNYKYGEMPMFYESLFPAWFGFYYLGIYVRSGVKIRCGGFWAVVAWIISWGEALWLRKCGIGNGLCISQITYGSFLYTVTVIGYFFNFMNDKDNKMKYVLSKVGDCSFGMFWIHMLVLKVVSSFLHCEKWLVYSGLRFMITTIISFSIVYFGKIIMKNHTKMIKTIGFV